MGDEELVQMVRQLADGPAFRPGPALASILDGGLETAAFPAAGRTTQRSNRMIPKIAAAIAAGLVGLGGLGVAGAMPDPIENAVADLASAVGVDRSDDKGDNGKGDHGDDEVKLVSEDTDTEDTESGQPEGNPDNFGDVVHDAKDDGATGQDIADLAHERNAERRDERDNPGQGHDRSDDRDDESDDDDDEPGRHLGHDK